MSETSDNCGSFWEPHNYKHTTRRIDDGHRLTGDLIKLVQDRADIERRYAKSLAEWSQKWSHNVQKGPEYGSTEKSWLSLLTEGERRSEQQLCLRQALIERIISPIRSFQKEHYHKTVLGGFKERKELDELFKKAQKPWLKLYNKVNKSKDDYYCACRSLRSAEIAERNALQDAAVSEEQRKRAADKVEKLREGVESCRKEYVVSLDDLNNYNAKYMEDMNEVFDKCQRIEKIRLDFFKQMIVELQQTLNPVRDDSLRMLYDELASSVSAADGAADLRWWSAHKGADMSMKWPSFEEYTEQFRDIRGKSGISKDNVDNGVTLINQRSTCDDLPPPEFLLRAVNNKYCDEKDLDDDKCCQPNDSDVIRGRQGTTSPSTPATLPRTSTSTTKKSVSSSLSSAPMANGAHSDDESDEANVVRVRALYNYDAVEDDELNLEEGEEFERLQDEDEQGWCTGRKNGKIGLYPSTYADAV